ncbi:MAG: hypothetical protein EOP09_19315, partial [Proteobacteria bacterium]
ILSLVTTHTTHFFRESDHFDFLMNEAFPRLIREGARVRIWSAACSSGQEVYSLAISVLEFVREKGLRLTPGQVEILGSDIDSASVDFAREGIYPSEQIAALPRELANRYFDQGTGKIGSFVRVTDAVHALCKFQKTNLLTDSFPARSFDVIFTRNVMIYFKRRDVELIAKKLAQSLSSQGYLMIGHSESLDGLQVPVKRAGNAIYRRESAVQTDPRDRLGDAKRLIVIGASTGGVEAVKAVLESLPAQVPPILIVQHIPPQFSQNFAVRLNEICSFPVSEAKNGECIQNAHAYIAPGGKQMRVQTRLDGLYLEVNDDPPMSSNKPSVDYLFRSVVSLTAQFEITAAILTGMG